MSETHQVGALQIGDDLDFVRRTWKFQRAGWVVMALVILAALLGVFGKGPLSTARVGEAGQALSVEYHRLWRYRKPDDITLHLGSQATTGREARVWLASDYVDKLEIEYITPNPDRVIAGSDRVIYVFNLAQPGQPVSITFNFSPQHVGALEAQVGVVDGPARGFTSFYYP